MIGPEEILKGLKNPRRACFELYRLVDQHVLGNTPVQVMERDWDNLVILDACRADMFREKNTLSGKLSTVTSVATQTLGFLEGNFDHEDFPETVYISANPNLELIDARFHDRVRLWETDWDEDLGVTRPEKVTEAAIDALAEYPDKRLIIHYMQPHYPFIGETGRAMHNEGIISYDFGHGNEFWRQLADPDIDTDRFKQAYGENLDIVLEELPDLCNGLDGKTVITSDHGNEFGRFGIYGHPRGVYSMGLVRVPWLEREATERRTITKGRASVGPRGDNDIAEERLALLGYKETVQ